MSHFVTRPPSWGNKRTKWLFFFAALFLLAAFIGPCVAHAITAKYDEKVAAEAKREAEKMKDPLLRLSDEELKNMPRNENPAVLVAINDPQPIEIEFATPLRWSREIQLPPSGKNYDFRLCCVPDTGFAVWFNDGTIFRCPKGAIGTTELGVRRGIFRLLGLQAGQVIQITFDVKNRR